MKKVLQIEYSQSILLNRANILRSEGFVVDSLFRDETSETRIQSNEEYGAVVIGHGGPWSDRRGLIDRLRQKYPKLPVIALFSRVDEPFQNASHNCPADDIVQWFGIIQRIVSRPRVN